MNQQDLLALVTKYLDGKASLEETDLLFQYYNKCQQTHEWPAELGDSEETEAAILQRLRTAMHNELGAVVRPFYKQTWIKMAAAVVIVAGSAAAFWFSNSDDKKGLPQTTTAKTGVKVTTDKPTLTLADGTVMVLDSLADGILITQANAIIRKQGEKVIIDPQDGLEEQPEPDAVAAYNVLEIPKGRQYEMVLPDGSQVWLNAASTLSFPPAFSSGERRVKITGEAYFEVAKNADKPFRVLATQMGGNSSNGTLVEVLGTHFNINAYEDEEAMKTTLLEGSVRIMTAGDSLAAAPKASVLTPGEQAEIQHTQTAAIDVKKVDVEEVVAWKSNVFNFNNTDLQTIMRQIARWYDVEVVYQGRIPVRYFSGKIKRTIPLSAVLEILEQSNIRFKLKGEQIVVKS